MDSEIGRLILCESTLKNAVAAMKRGDMPRDVALVSRKFHVAYECERAALVAREWCRAFGRNWRRVKREGRRAYEQRKRQLRGFR